MDNFDSKATFSVWQKFVDTGILVNHSIVPEQIIESWTRSVANKVNPYQKINSHVLSSIQIKNLLSKNEEIISLSKPFLENLYSFMAGSKFVVALFDPSGYILDIMGDEDVISQIKTVNFIVGANWGESSVGTSCVSLILHHNSPMQVRASEHFYRHGHGITGSGAPIQNLSGKLLAGLTIFGPAKNANPHTLGMAVAAAHAINYYIRSIKEHTKVRLASDFRKLVLESLPEAIVVLNSDHNIWLTNERAKEVLNLSQKCVGQNFIESLGKGNTAVLNLINDRKSIVDEEIKIICKGSSKNLTLTCNAFICSEKSDIGKLLIFNELSRAKILANRMVGAKAKLKFTDFIGQHSSHLESVRLGKKAAQSSSNVLILGESGSGKNILAQAIHNESNRANGPFVLVNCAAIPRELISSELFGYADGAFTGSKRGGNPGKFELADGGTICLDEIGEMPLDLQTALLSVLEDRSIVRVGGKEVTPVNVRIIATTNRNLKEAIDKGQFRADLYYRLNVVTIELPPLRERISDIAILAKHFAKVIGYKTHNDPFTISEKAIDILSSYSWPGNARELSNVIERAINITAGNIIEEDNLPSDIPRDNFIIAQNKFINIKDKCSERQILIDKINSYMPKTKIAEELNISRCTLYRKLKKYGISN